MRVKADITTRVIQSSKDIATKSIHIKLGSDLDIEEGDTIVLNAGRRRFIEIIKRKVTPDFSPPYYASY